VYRIILMLCDRWTKERQGKPPVERHSSERLSAIFFLSRAPGGALESNLHDGCVEYRSFHFHYLLGLYVDERTVDATGQRVRANPSETLFRALVALREPYTPLTLSSNLAPQYKFGFWKQSCHSYVCFPRYPTRYCCVRVISCTEKVPSRPLVALECGVASREPVKLQPLRVMDLIWTRSVPTRLWAWPALGIQ